MPVVLVFHDRNDHELGTLTELDADTLADELLAPPSEAGKQVAKKLHAAAKASTEGATSAVFLDRDGLEVVHSMHRVNPN